MLLVRMRCASLVCLVCLVLTSCSLVWPIARDDAAPEAGLNAGFDAGTDARLDAPNLIKNGDFEQGCAASWQGYRATLSDDAVHRSPTRSCRICTTDVVGGFFRAVTGSLVRDYVHGETYWVEACVRTPEDAAPPLSVRVGLYVMVRGNNGPIESALSSARPLTSDWRCYTASIFDTPDAGQDLAAAVEFTTDARDRCFLVDDVRVYQMQ